MNMKRMRGRNNRGSGGGGGGGGGNGGGPIRRHDGNIPLNRNHVFDSNGPDLRIRGTAQQLFEKYLQLGRDATSSGDRVMAEGYFQHADHYFRIVNAINQATQQQGGQQQGGQQHGQQGHQSGQHQGNAQHNGQPQQDSDQSEGGEFEEQPNGLGDQPTTDPHEIPILAGSGE